MSLARLKPYFSPRALTFALTLAATLVGLWAPRYLPINYDTGARLGLAAQYLDTTDWHDEFLDYEMPLVLAFHMVPVMISRLLGVGAYGAYIACIQCVKLLAVYLAWRTIVRNPRLGERGACLLTLGFLYVVDIFANLPIDMGYAGQREHWLSILIWPYLALCLNQIHDVTEKSLRVRLGAGLLAALGFSLKPYFAILFAASELFLMLWRRDPLVWRRPESLAVGILGSLYALFWWMCCQRQMHDLGKDFEIVDSVYRPFFILVFAGAFYGWPTIITLIAAVCTAARDKRGPLLYTAVLMAAGVAVAFLQQRAALVHAYPVICFLVMTVCLAFRSLPYAPAYAVMGILLVQWNYAIDWRFSHSWRTAWRELRERTADVNDSAALLAPYVRGQTVARLNILISTVSPTLLMSGAKWSGPLRHILYLNSACKREPEQVCGRTLPLDRLNATEHYYHDKLVRFLLERKPEFVLVELAPRGAPQTTAHIDLIAQFSLDARFAAVWRHYHRVPLPCTTLALYRYASP